MPVKIKDILFTSVYLGEFSTSNQFIENLYFRQRPLVMDSGVRDVGRIERMRSQISDIFDRVQYQHEEQLKQTTDTDELITRGIIDEFSFYTKNYPLSLEEYNEIINFIAELALKLPPNIHIQLGTFPVLWPNGVVQNCALYVQSPKKKEEKPCIHHFSKLEGSYIDPQYAYWNEEKKSIFVYPLSGDNTELDRLCEPGNKYSPEHVLKNENLQIGDINQYRNAIKIKSAQGEEFFSVSEICYDHRKGVGQQDLSFLIKKLSENGEFLPYRATHIISSKTTISLIKNLVATVAHADVKVKKIGRLKPEAVYAASHEASSFFDCSVYPEREIGILTGPNFFLVVDANQNNQKSFNVDELLEGKTLLHHVVQKSETDVRLILKRIDALSRFNASIDIPDSEGKTVRMYIIDQLYQANASGDLTAARRFLRIAKKLHMFNEDFKEAIYEEYLQGNLQNKVLPLLRKYLPDLFNMQGEMVDPFSLARKHEDLTNQYNDLKEELSKSNPSVALIKLQIHSNPQLLRQPFSKEKSIAEKILTSIVLDTQDITLYQMVRYHINLLHVISRSVEPTKAAQKILEMELQLVDSNPILVHHLISQYGLSRHKGKDHITYAKKALFLSSTTFYLPLYETVRNEVNVAEETMKYSNPQAAAIGFLAMEINLPYPNPDIIYNLFKKYPELIYMQQNDGLTLGHKALGIALNTNRADLYDLVKNEVDVCHATTYFGNPRYVAERFLLNEFNSPEPNFYHIRNILIQYPNIIHALCDKEGTTYGQEALVLAFENKNIALYLSIRNQVNVCHVTRLFDSPDDQEAAWTFLCMELDSNLLNPYVIVSLLKAYPDLMNYSHNNRKVSEIISNLAITTNHHELLSFVNSNITPPKKLPQKDEAWLQTFQISEKFDAQNFLDVLMFNITTINSGLLINRKDFRFDKDNQGNILIRLSTSASLQAQQAVDMAIFKLFGPSAKYTLDVISSRGQQVSTTIHVIPIAQLRQVPRLNAAFGEKSVAYYKQQLNVFSKQDNSQKNQDEINDFRPMKKN